MKISSKQKNVWEKIFQKPVLASLAWKEVESLFAYLGAEVSEGQGSRVRVALNGVRGVFHRPHPSKEIDKGALASARRFLIEAGYNYDEI